MRTSLLPALLAGAGFATLAGTPAPAAGTPGGSEIRRLIGQLGSGNFSEREDASAALDAAGEAALPGLRAAAESEDAEVRRRAGELVQRIEQRVETEHLLSPTKVQLSFKETTVREALNELHRQSGYDVVLADPRNKLKDRKVTLDTGETTFWEALDRLCERANLAEEGPPSAGVDVAGRAVAPPLVPAAPAPPLVVGGRVRPVAGRPVPVVPQLRLVEAGPPAPATAYAGAVRVRGKRARDAGDPGHVTLDLTVFGEPKLRLLDFFTLRLDQVVDDQGQVLVPADDVPASPFAPNWRYAVPPGGGFSVQYLQARLNVGEKPTRSLREVRGTLSARLVSEPRQLLAVDEVVKSAGKRVAGKDGAALKVLEAAADAGRFTLRVELEMPQELAYQAAPVVARVRNARGGRPALPPAVGGAAPAPLPAVAPPAAGVATAPQRDAGLSLLDDSGSALQATGMRLNFRKDPRGTVVREYSLEFQVPAGRQATRLVFSAGKVIPVDLPFTLKDVPLP
jgi:hypothetical protein